MNYLSLHSLAVLGLLALAAGCAATSSEAGSASADVTGEQLDFASAALPPLSSISLAKAPDGSLYATYTSQNQLVVARSLDHGVHWQTLSTPRQSNLGARIYAAPSNPNVLYLTRRGWYSWGGAPPPSDDASGFLLRSEDGGETWIDRTATLPEVSQGSGFATLDIHPTDDQHLVAANCKGLQRSIDGGRSWSVVPGSASTMGDCNSADLARGIDDRKTLYVLSDVGEGGGSTLRRSFDDGVTWEDAKLGASTDALVGVRDVVVHPNDARHVYVTDIQSFYSSANAGDDFFRHGRNLQGAPSSVAVNPSDGALYVTSRDSIYRWVPSAEPENGHWSVVGKVSGAELGAPVIIDGRIFVTTQTQLLSAPLK